ncbi:FAR1-related sequence 2 [Striga asiatica]|uniref:FAR1-related sequence 2 n=1 Tax=Striga asiatica TaxID=4170 RepID=A0A5A7PTL7_STRAF|nr:FAR1-related sequence 2 [Striga asiatica]
MGITPAQKRYDDMCRAFVEVADLAADDEEKYTSSQDWIENKKNELILTKYDSSDNNSSQYTSRQKMENGNIKDPKTSKTKGAPMSSKKEKARSRHVNKNGPVHKPESITNVALELFPAESSWLQRFVRGEVTREKTNVIREAANVTPKFRQMNKNKEISSRHCSFPNSDE